MRKLSAHYIFTGNGDVLQKGIITLDNDGHVLEVTDTHGQLTEQANIEFYSGVIVPGFVNCHCHLELSHLHALFPEKTGLPDFLKNVVAHRPDDKTSIEKAARIADLKMWKNGIVAVGDISNGMDSFRVKAESKLFYHTFIETLGFSPERAEKAFAWSEFCRQAAHDFGLDSSVVPHAPYSISARLFGLIAEKAKVENTILSIHNQESADEDQLYQNGSGSLAQHLKDNLGIDISFFQPTGKSALETVLSYLPAENHLLLVHNIYTSKHDVQKIHTMRSEGKTWFVLCPASNCYIENRLPDIAMLRKSGIPICLGTDSLSSNHELSVLNEISYIQYFFPEITFTELISWATRNGAAALKIDHRYGTIEPGKQPGINLISGLEPETFRVLPSARVKRLF